MLPPENPDDRTSSFLGENEDIMRDETSIPMTIETPVLRPSLRSRLNIRSRRPSRLITPCSVFLLILLVLRLFVGIIGSPNVLQGMVFAIIAVLPTFVVALFVLKQFPDDLANKPFLLMQFLISAIPLVIIVVIVELFFIAISALPIIGFAFDKIKDKAPELLSAIQDGKDQEVFAIIQDIAESIPLAAMIISLLLIAYLSAGMVEEVGKWLVARRFLGLECVCGNDDKRIGCRGILAAACMAGLGFATTENIGYVMGMARIETPGFLGLVVLLGLFRGIVALPVHVGTQLYVAIAAAQRYVFLDGGSVMWALVQAIFFHGTFDAIAFITSFLVGLGRIPAWTAILVAVFDVVMVGLLILVCRARYKGLLERERVSVFSEPV